MRPRLTLLALMAVPVLAAGPDFQREVRPILSDACFHCHGPDKSTRMVGLRLDTREGALGTRKTGAPVVPGDTRSSLVYQRITHENKARRMPPLSSHKTLTEKQIDTLRRWIESGAEWKEHWAFTAPQRPPVPKTVHAAWARTPIDSFILSQLEKNGLAPAPAADKRTLIRRVTLDVTGLPPTPEEVEAFVKDTGPKAYEKLIDRLMQSPAWGEHRGRYWLDAARYGDTHGIHIDNYREIWPYRDWIIKAFNRNLLFDRFTVEQLAGDLLPDPTMDQLIATGFHRSNATTNEGGVIPEEVAAMNAKDRVDTTGTVFLGMTLGCATCHDHKFDPIPQRDFYAMAAFFRNTTQDPLDGNIHDTPPVIVVPREEDLARWKQIGEEEGRLLARLAQAREASGPEFAKWLGEDSRAKIASPLEPADELFAVNANGVTVRNRTSQPAAADGVRTADGHLPGVRALEFGPKAGYQFESFEYFDADRPFTVAAWVRVPKGDENSVLVSQSDAASRGRGWAVELNERLPLLRLTYAANKSLSVRTGITKRLEPGRWYHLAFSYDGSRAASGLKLYIDGARSLAETYGEMKPFAGNFRNYAPLAVGSNGRRDFAGGALVELRIFTRELSDGDVRLAAAWPAIEQARSKPAADLSAAEREALQLYYLHREYGTYMDLAAKLRALAEERKPIARSGAVTHIQQEIKDQKPFAHVLHRGMYDQPRDKVEPAVPSALPPLPASYPRNRLGLARWLVDANNPLFARVTVNRFWQEVFGTGLVKTSEDFGSQGQPPSHPELLDWLAVEFRESGWDVQKLFRLMLSSSTYRQAAFSTPLKLRKDPENRLLSRGPRFRMDAEMVRDYALAASGLLVRRLGGPSVKPYQPEGVWEAVAMNESNTRFYARDSGEDLYRRSMYTFWKRSAPPASMDIFNAPSRESCTVRRERTNTPLQALVTMNDPQFLEAARQLAAAALLESGGDSDRTLDVISRRLLARVLQVPERGIAKLAYKDYLSYYGSHPDEAGKLISVGESEVPSGIPPAQLAAATVLANQMMNLDEVLSK